MKRNNSNQEKKIVPSTVYFVLSCIAWIFAILMVLGFICLLFPVLGSGKTEDKAQEDAFWELQDEADEGARKAEDYERKQRELKKN